jgi:epoxide hydrolase 4
MSLDQSSLERLVFRNGDIHLRAVAAGPAAGPAILLLHGFPEFWYGWRKQIGPLASAGFRVIALDQRGYNDSSKPRRAADFSVQHLVSDVVAVIEQLGRERVFIVGHDWGAMVAWTLAARHPERVERLAILNVPHPGVMMRFLFTHPRQLLRSWYMFFFQFPRLPEMLFAAGNYKRGLDALVKTSRPGTFSEQDLQLYREAWARPGAVSAMINWYRALFRRSTTSRLGTIKTPTLLLWGKQDAFLEASLATESLRKCDSAELVWFPQATHWVQHEEADAVNEALLRFFRE